jgi:uncharacterized membrane protein YhaH (DUF805 family)
VNWRHFLFSFNGRSDRAKQWLFFALLLVPVLVYEFAVENSLGLGWREFGRMASFQDLQNPSSVKVLMFMAPLWLITAIPTLAVGVKRLHDRNRSGWWIILFVYVPWALSIIQLTLLPKIVQGANLDPALALTLSGLVVFGIEIWAFVELYCLRGTVGENRFGPDPLGTPVEQVFE